MALNTGNPATSDPKLTDTVTGVPTGCPYPGIASHMLSLLAIVSVLAGQAKHAPALLCIFFSAPLASAGVCPPLQFHTEYKGGVAVMNALLHGTHAHVPCN